MLNITIDGKAGCGKSTLADELSKRLNIKKFNTGAVYRAIACEYLKRYESKNPNEEIINEFVKNLDIKVVFDNNVQKVIVNDEDYTPFLREERISNFVAKVSPYDIVRQKVREIQREFAKSNDCIMEGRDIGSVVLTNAKIKLFITASNEVRAQRRVNQLKEQNVKVDYDEILKEINDRDYQDVHREHGALLPAKDAIIIDNSNETLEQTIDRCLDIINSNK